MTEEGEPATMLGASPDPRQEKGCPLKERMQGRERLHRSSTATLDKFRGGDASYHLLSAYWMPGTVPRAQPSSCMLPISHRTDVTITTTTIL